MIRAHLQRLGHAGVPVAQAHTLGQSQALEGGLHTGQVVATDMVPNLGSTSDTHGIPACFTMMQAPASTPTLSPKLILLHFDWRRDDRLLVSVVDGLTHQLPICLDRLPKVVIGFMSFCVRSDPRGLARRARGDLKHLHRRSLRVRHQQGGHRRQLAEVLHQQGSVRAASA